MTLFKRIFKFANRKKAPFQIDRSFYSDTVTILGKIQIKC